MALLSNLHAIEKGCSKDRLGRRDVFGHSSRTSIT
jgi:hypothetical protein